MISRHTIHLADGDDPRRRALARALRDRGFEVLEFARGSELFERALAAPPDLIVSALDLDVMDAFQVVEWLRRRRPETHGRVVFLTRSADPVLAQACALRGARACLDGATAPDSLAAAIEAALPRGAGQSPARSAIAAAAARTPAPLGRSAPGPSPRRAVWRAPAYTERASRGAEERAAIAALRERWHARDGSKESPNGGNGRVVPRRAPGAMLAVLALVLCAGFGLAVVRSADFPALVERLGRLRALATERAVQAVRAPVLASRTATVEGGPEPTPAVAELVTPVAAPSLEPAPSIAPVPVPPVAGAAAAPSGRAPDYNLAAIRDRPQFVYVDVPPAPHAPLRPSYPRALVERKIGGTVTLWVLVSETGRVDDVRVLRSSGHPELDKAAVDALRLASYEPARRGGVAVPTWTRQQIAFRLD